MYKFALKCYNVEAPSLPTFAVLHPGEREHDMADNPCFIESDDQTLLDDPDMDTSMSGMYNSASCFFVVRTRSELASLAHSFYVCMEM